MQHSVQINIYQYLLLGFTLDCVQYNVDSALHCFVLSWVAYILVNVQPIAPFRPSLRHHVVYLNWFECRIFDSYIWIDSLKQWHFLSQQSETFNILTANSSIFLHIYLWNTIVANNNRGMSSPLLIKFTFQ